MRRRRTRSAAAQDKKEAAKQPREHPNREEEAGPADDPALTVRRDAIARHRAVHARMVQQILPPHVQDRDEADFRAPVCRIAEIVRIVSALVRNSRSSRVFLFWYASAAMGSGSVKTTWKYSIEGRSSARWRASHCARGSDWHFGQQRWRHESQAMR